MRKTRAKKRVLLPDPKFNDTLVTRFVNNLMWDGKKSVAFNIRLRSDEGTLVDSQIQEIMSKTVTALDETYGAKLR